MKAQFVITIKDGVVENVVSNVELDYVITVIEGDNEYNCGVYANDSIDPMLRLGDFDCI